MDTWAFVLFKKGELEEAEHIAENTCALAQQVAAPFYTLGKILKAKERLVLADLCFLRVLALEKGRTKFYRDAEREMGFKGGG